MSVKIKDHTASIKLNTQRRSSLALRFMLEDIHQISEPKTPRRTGGLRRNVRKSVVGLKGTISWGQNYAIYQENKQFRNYTTAGTGPHFAESSVSSVTKSPLGAMRKAKLI